MIINWLKCLENVKKQTEKEEKIEIRESSTIFFQSIYFLVLELKLSID